MRGRSSMGSLRLLLVSAVILGCERQQQTVVSQPLRAAAVDSLVFVGEPVWFSDQVVGRHLASPKGAMAIERICFLVGGDTVPRTFADLEDLASRNAITETTEIEVLRERTLIMGDSAFAAGVMDNGQARWHRQASSEQNPHQSVYPGNPFCGMAGSDETR